MQLVLLDSPCTPATIACARQDSATASGAARFKSARIRRAREISAAVTQTKTNAHRQECLCYSFGARHRQTAKEPAGRRRYERLPRRRDEQQVPRRRKTASLGMTTREGFESKGKEPREGASRRGTVRLGRTPGEALPGSQRRAHSRDRDVLVLACAKVLCRAQHAAPLRRSGKRAGETPALSSQKQRLP